MVPSGCQLRAAKRPAADRDRRTARERQLPELGVTGLGRSRSRIHPCAVRREERPQPLLGCRDRLRFDWSSGAGRAAAATSLRAKRDRAAVGRDGQLVDSQLGRQRDLEAARRRDGCAEERSATHAAAAPSVAAATATPASDSVPRTPARGRSRSAASSVPARLPRSSSRASPASRSASCAVALEAAAQEPSRTAGGVCAGSSAPVELVAQHRGERLGSCPRRAKAAPAGQHLEQHDAEGPDVGALVDRAAARLLRAHVGRGADDHAHLRVVSVAASARRSPSSGRAESSSGQRLGQAEVEHLDLAVGRHLDVGGLEVAVHDALLVRRFERHRRSGARSASASSTGDAARAAAARRASRPPPARARAAASRRDVLEAVDRRDVGMVERGQHLRLALETRQRSALAREALGQDLERHVALERRVVRPEHLAHAARAELAEDAIDADPAAQGQRHRAPRLPQPTLDLVARAGCLVGGRRGSTSGAATRAIMPHARAMGLQPGDRLGPYEIQALLGVGGMGEVYRGRDTRLGRDVALKVISPKRVEDASLRRRFELEARAASVLNHPSIVTVYDVGETAGVSWIAMEWVEGRTLRQMLGKGALADRATRSRSRGRSPTGSRPRTRKGVVHRDLKPENVMVTAEDRAKILDFGLARLTTADAPPEPVSRLETLESPPDATRDGTILGTVGYMSPEQAAGRPADFRSDQFSFGLIAYEMLSGRRAFARPTAPETQAAIIREEPVPARVAAQRNPEGAPGRDRRLPGQAPRGPLRLDPRARGGARLDRRAARRRRPGHDRERDASSRRAEAVKRPRLRHPALIPGAVLALSPGRLCRDEAPGRAPPRSSRSPCCRSAARAATPTASP